MIRKQEEDVKEEQSKIKVKIKEKNAELKKLPGEEKKITPGLDEDILFKFERIIRNKSGIGIVLLAKGVCTGCYMILPPQFVNTVRLGAEVEFCPYCSRILFYQEDEEGESLETAIIEEEAERTRRRKRKRTRRPKRKRRRSSSRLASPLSPFTSMTPRAAPGLLPSGQTACRSGRSRRVLRPRLPRPRGCSLSAFGR